jgi:DNA-binding HxlR family transcriptional regulator
MSNQPKTPEVDRVVHEPARLRIMTMLSGVAAADFNFLRTALGLTNGNLSCHMDRLERAGYVEVEKEFVGKMPHTQYKLTPAGRTALEGYWAALDSMRSFKPE